MAIIVLFVGGYWFLEIKYSGRRRVLESYNRGDLDGFLKFVDPEIKRATTAKIRDFLLLHKAEALFYKRDFAGSTSVLNEMDKGTLTKEFLPYYYKLQLDNLLLSENLEEARRLYNQILRPIMEGDAALPEQFKFTKGIYRFYTGDISESRDIFLQLTDAEITPMCKGLVDYFLGQTENAISG